MMLQREEYVEQAYFYKTLRERLESGGATQELLRMIRHELLASTKLTMAVDFMVVELNHSGRFATAMARLPHYFTPLQAYLIAEAENEEGQFDFPIALRILEQEARYRTESPSLQGLFFYQFEVLCRNRLRYDQGLAAIAGDPIYDDAWRQWLDILRRQIGLVDFADLIAVRSAYYEKKPGEEDIPVLFGEREGKIAVSSRRKDPLYLFSALQRHLEYPPVPRHKRAADPESLVPILQTRIEQLEAKVDLLQEEVRGGINLSRYYVREDDSTRR